MTTQPIVRDEEVVGSNPATPTPVRGPFAQLADGPLCVRNPQCGTAPPCRAPCPRAFTPPPPGSPGPWHASPPAAACPRAGTAQAVPSHRPAWSTTRDAPVGSRRPGRRAGGAGAHDGARVGEGGRGRDEQVGEGRRAGRRGPAGEPRRCASWASRCRSAPAGTGRCPLPARRCRAGPAPRGRWRIDPARRRSRGQIEPRRLRGPGTAAHDTHIADVGADTAAFAPADRFVTERNHP